MATLGGRYLNEHQSQYDPGQSTITRREGCSWTTVANGADASTGGRVKKTPDQVHALIPKSSETNPLTPGWSTVDVDRACAKLGVPFEIRSGQGWPAVVRALDVEHLYVFLQGDSDRFPSGCSGEFDGNHAIGVHPASRVVNGLRQRWTDDPICPDGRWEWEYILRNYAVKFSAGIQFGVFSNPVPAATVPTRWKVTITGKTVLYNRVGGTPVGAVTLASYIVTKTKYQGEWWYKIVSGKRAGQALKPNRYTKFSIIPA